MIRSFLVGCALIIHVGSVVAAPVDAKAFVQSHCVACHGAEKAAGDVRLDDLPADITADLKRWAIVRDQVRDGLMPPPKQTKVPMPPSAASRQLVAELTARTGQRPARLPNQGNLIPHELLFGRAASPSEPPAPRVWRLNPDGYNGFVRNVARGRVDGLIAPFVMLPERGIKDFAQLYTIDEPSTEVLIRNAEAIVKSQSAHEIKDGKLQAKHDTVREFTMLMDPKIEPTRAQLEAAIQMQFKLAIARTATTDEVERLIALYERCAKLGDRPEAVKTMLQAILLRTDAMFRSEIGTGSGARLLAPHELANAITLALGERRDQLLFTAASKGELQTAEQVALHIRRILEDPKADKSRTIRFFREYFEYDNAVNVFKDKPATFVHSPAQYVSDTDRLVQYIVAQDKDVFRELLTTRRSYVNYATKQNKQTRKDDPVPAVIVNPNNDKGKTGVESVYGITDWPREQPTELPEGQRIGILMQPSWLIAWSTNFENDPVRRGRWVRERLLGGNVPDLPIGVVAQVPDDPHRTFRDRLMVTRQAQCWKCHQRMDELGLPFEQFDHFGRFRLREPVLDVEATAKNIDKKGKPLGNIYREVDLVTSGMIRDSGDVSIDGEVRDPREMIQRIANSDRARQVFIRHAFRFYMGRNESLSDAQTLQDADRAYVASGGSYKALIVSLLTSRSFLYRAESSERVAK